MIDSNDNVILRPDLLAHRYDPEHDAVHLLSVDRETRRRVPFLTDDEIRSAERPLVVKRPDAVALAGDEVPINFIFHSAYCCSTLLANAYDRPGRVSSLKEPVLLNDLVGWRHRGATPANVGEVLADSLKLLARPFNPTESCVIKPSNVVNGLAAAMLAFRPHARAVLLFAPLEEYLRSIAAKGLWGRRWVRDLLAKQLREGIVDLGFSEQDHFLQTDLQVAAVGWLAQRALFGSIAERYPERVRTLGSGALLEHPESALMAIDELFGIEATQRERADIVGAVFSRHAKTGGAFGADDRGADQSRSADAHAEEIGFVLQWSYAVAEAAAVEIDDRGTLFARDAGSNAGDAETIRRS